VVKRAWQAWKNIAHKVGNFQARILLTLFYAVLVLPFGIVCRLFRDALRIKRPPAEWLNHPDETYDMQWARRQ
jgi:hypothetical protein